MFNGLTAQEEESFRALAGQAYTGKLTSTAAWIAAVRVLRDR